MSKSNDIIGQCMENCGIVILIGMLVAPVHHGAGATLVITAFGAIAVLVVAKLFALAVRAFDDLIG